MGQKAQVSRLLKEELIETVRKYSSVCLSVSYSRGASELGQSSRFFHFDLVRQCNVVQNVVEEI